MKRFFGLLIICSLLLSGFGAFTVPPPPKPVYLPFLMQTGGGGGGTFTVSGAVRDVDHIPVSNVTITDVNGAVAVTNFEGEYSINVEPGANTLTAVRSGYDIAPLNINVASNLSAVNFTAQVGCGSILVNESVTVGMGGWDFETNKPDDVIAGTDTLLFRSAPSSGRVGIDVFFPVNVASITKARSQLYHIPTDAEAVFLGVWVYRIDTGAGGTDWQYIDILDENNNLIGQPLYAQKDINAAWTFLEFPMDGFIGEDIKIQFRVLNDGGVSFSTMFFDDVSLIICNTSCDDQIINGGFEVQVGPEPVTGWLYIGPQVVPPAFSMTYAHTGLWSMRTGIPATITDTIATTEVFQRNIDLPSSHSGAMLTFWLNVTRVDGIVPPIEPAPPADFGPTRAVPSLSGSSFSPLLETGTPEEDWLYVYVYDDEGDFLERLMWEKTIDSKNTWLRYRFDLSDYMGQKIQLLFGTYNDGRGGPSAVYIDDVVLGTCE